MPGQRCPARSRRAAAALSLLVLAGCAGKQNLGDYDFRGRTLAAVTIAPPHPEVLSGAQLDVDSKNPVESILRVGSEIAREVGVRRVRARLDSAAATVSVSDRMTERLHGNAARHLRAREVEEVAGADYELEIRVRRYGIVASSMSSGAHFLIDAQLSLLDGRSGRRIWQTDVTARDPVRTGASGGDSSLTNVVTGIELAGMPTAEIERALESLADFAADQMLDRLVRALDDARE